MTIRVSIYHWLPLADNMLPDIQSAIIQRMDTEMPLDEQAQDAISYKVRFSFSVGSTPAGNYLIHGKINQRGFVQHVLILAPIPGLSLSGTLDALVSRFRDFLTDYLFDIAPLSVRNKLAVLNEGIFSFEEYESKTFEALVSAPAKGFLRDYQLAAIMISSEHQEEILLGFKVPSIGLDIVQSNESPRTIISSDEHTFLFYTDKFEDEEQYIHDSVIYKFCALITFMRFVARVIHILKQVRDHVIPLRRQLVIKLQRDTEEHFIWLTRVKKYLTYVNVKLPVVQKVLNHLSAAKKSPQFKAKLSTLQDPAKLTNYPSLSKLPKTHLQVPRVIDKINEDAIRLEALYTEDATEIETLSHELSEVLDGSLLSEGVQISTRELDAARLSLELDRGGKNRANALKVLSILLSANLGALLASSFTRVLFPYIEAQLEIYTTLLGALLVPIFAGIFTEWYIRRKSWYYRLFIPITVSLPRSSLEMLVKSKGLRRSESIGTRRTITWSEHFNPKSITHGLKPLWQQLCRFGLFSEFGPLKKFDITLDYEMRGYVHSITLETEYFRNELDSLALVVQTLYRLGETGCLDGYSSNQPETSLLAEALSNLGIPINNDLIALNKILTLPVEELWRLITASQDERLSSSMSAQDKELTNDIVRRKHDYVRWLLNAKQGADIDVMARLLGIENLERKADAIGQIAIR